MEFDVRIYICLKQYIGNNFFLILIASLSIIVLNYYTEIAERNWDFFNTLVQEEASKS